MSETLLVVSLPFVHPYLVSSHCSGSGGMQRTKQTESLPRRSGCPAGEAYRKPR